MTRRRILMAVLLLAILAGGPVRAHEVFRFVGFITKVDAKKATIDMQSREEWHGKVGQYMRHLVLREECRVMRLSAEVKRSELTVGQHVVVDAAGVDINDLEATEIEIIVLSPAKKK